MKRRVLLLTFMTIICLLAMPSCTKSTQQSLLGRYYFKMSGNLKCKNIDTGEDANFMLVSQSGQMHVINGENDSYIVNMSVMLGGNVMSFQASYQNDIFSLAKHTVAVSVKPEGSSSGTFLINSGSVVNIALEGSGKLYDDNTLMIQISPSGKFEYNNVEYEISSSGNDIVCMANKEN